MNQSLPLAFSPALRKVSFLRLFACLGSGLLLSSVAVYSAEASEVRVEPDWTEQGEYHNRLKSHTVRKSSLLTFTLHLATQPTDVANKQVAEASREPPPPGDGTKVSADNKGQIIINWAHVDRPVVWWRGDDREERKKDEQSAPVLWPPRLPWPPSKPAPPEGTAYTFKVRSLSKVLDEEKQRIRNLRGAPGKANECDEYMLGLRLLCSLTNQRVTRYNLYQQALDDGDLRRPVPWGLAAEDLFIRHRWLTEWVEAAHDLRNAIKSDDVQAPLIWKGPMLSLSNLIAFIQAAYPADGTDFIHLAVAPEGPPSANKPAGGSTSAISRYREPSYSQWLRADIVLIQKVLRENNTAAATLRRTGNTTSRRLTAFLAAKPEAVSLADLVQLGIACDSFF